MIVAHARPSDLDQVMVLEKAGFPKEQRWSREAWAEELGNQARLVLARHDLRDALIGVATFSAAGDVVDLLRVIVHPDQRGRGIGSSLIRTGMEWAKAIGAHRMLLEVRPDNKRALKVYSKLGFEQLSRRRDYYGPGIDAMVMAVKL